MAEQIEVAAPKVVTDSFLGGRLLLRQPEAGHRCGTDAVLLAAAAPGGFSGLAIDAGAGAGGAGLALAAACPGARVAFLEADPFTAGLARENLAQNGLEDRCYVAEADLFAPASRRAAGIHEEMAGLVITNPPFLDPGKARLPQEPGKLRARSMPAEGPAPLAAWIAASLALIAPGGLFIVIHRPDALPIILQSLAGRAGGVTLLPVHPRHGSEAVRILLRAKKGSRAPLAIAPPLVLHDEKGLTPGADAIHRGEAMIAW
ncbi:MAG: methyltransferase [Beijerinckiaceae bacterium]|nr:methyltransferase [Beijerinckiaceae bacterium]